MSCFSHCFSVRSLTLSNSPHCSHARQASSCGLRCLTARLSTCPPAQPAPCPVCKLWQGCFLLPHPHIPVFFSCKLATTHNISSQSFNFNEPEETKIRDSCLILTQTVWDSSTYYRWLLFMITRMFPVVFVPLCLWHMTQTASLSVSILHIPWPTLYYTSQPTFPFELCIA